MLTIVIADDHPIVRLGLQALIEAEHEYAIVGQAEDGLTAAQLVQRLKPAILIIDLVLPGLNGIEVTRRARQDAPDTRVIILSLHDNEAHVLESLRAGAAGYVLKSSSTTYLIHAVREVAAGRRYLSPPLSEWAIEAFMRQTSLDATDLDRHALLTSREQEVLHLAAQSLSNGEIGARLSISPRTVETHRSNLMRKLNLHSQTDLIRYAIQRGII